MVTSTVKVLTAGLCHEDWESTLNEDSVPQLFSVMLKV